MVNLSIFPVQCPFPHPAYIRLLIVLILRYLLILDTIGFDSIVPAGRLAIGLLLALLLLFRR